MFTVAYALAIGLTILVAVLFLTFMDLTFAGGKGAASPGWRPWRPPLATGTQLSQWATNVARVVATLQLARRRTNTAPQLMKAIYKGTSLAIAQSPFTLPQTKPLCADLGERFIGVTPPEAIAIAEQIQTTRPKAEVRQIQERAQKNAELTVNLAPQQYEQAHIVCPLRNTNHACATFEMRPLDCRGCCICDCDGQNVLAPVNDPQTSCDLSAYAIASGVKEGLSQALGSAGLDGNLYELNSALATALATPNAARKWVQGKPVFANCKAIA